MKKPQRYRPTAPHNVGIAWPTVDDEVGIMTTEPSLAEGATDYYESEEMDEWLKAEVLPVLRTVKMALGASLHMPGVTRPTIENVAALIATMEATDER